MYNGSQLPYGAQMYDSEHLRAASRYGIDPHSGSMPSFTPAMHARAMANLHRPTPKARAKQQAAAAQTQAQANPRHEDDNDIGDGLEENCFSLVSTEELEKQGLRPHPDKIAEAAALSSVALPAGSYKMCLPAQVIQGNLQLITALCGYELTSKNPTFHAFMQVTSVPCSFRLSDSPATSTKRFFQMALAQAFSWVTVRAVELTCFLTQHYCLFCLTRLHTAAQMSDTGSDVTGPGVGKGRQIASLVFENILRGRSKVCFSFVFEPVILAGRLPCTACSC